MNIVMLFLNICKYLKAELYTDKKNYVVSLCAFTMFGYLWSTKTLTHYSSDTILAVKFKCDLLFVNLGILAVVKIMIIIIPRWSC